MIHVVIAEDQALVRAGFRVLVDSAPDMTVVGEAGDGAEAVRLVAQHRPEVVLMDLHMPVLNGIAATQTITSDPMNANTRVLILTTFDLDEYVFQALQAGASGFLLKDTAPEQLLAGVRVVAAGEAILAPSVTRTLIETFTTRPGLKRRVPAELTAVLTPREREVLLEVAGGYSNAEIGDRLNISTGTAKTHVSRLLTKLQARDRAQLVMLAYESGLAAPQ